jgi:hypothetical protein
LRWLLERIERVILLWVLLSFPKEARIPNFSSSRL